MLFPRFRVVALFIGLAASWAPTLRADRPPRNTPPTQQPGPLDPKDPLLQALQRLQRDIDQLRSEIRGQSPAGRSMAPAKPRGVPAPSPSMSMPAPSSRPRAAAGTRTPLPSAAPIETSRSDHWAFQGAVRPPLPAVADESWSRDDLDRFILHRLERDKLRPNPDADRHALIRRIAFDLTGLPPTEKELRSFVRDEAPLDEALATAVDRYLDSDRFGERWGRHWLDVVRYADSVGRNWNAPFTYAWRYRDYVIDSLNSDKPYDRFVTEQLAGDLLPAADLAERREQLVGTGLLALGPTDIIVPEGEKLMMDRVDEQIDVVTRGMLALTVSCARCHDHKYEPVSMRDYYALAGVFCSTETLSGQRRGNYVDDRDLRLLPSPDGRTSPIPGVHSMADMQRMGWREILWTTDPNLAMGVAEGRVEDCPIRHGGDYYRRGEVVPRGDIRIAGLSGLANIRSGESGRLQLARWIASAENPLTARVIVNRVWQHLFGRGLVPTVDNFGQSGRPPTHPALLDHLATRFVDGRLSRGAAETGHRATAWSIKSLIRSIVLSRTYRMSSDGQAAAQQIDPQNEAYWRMNIRRLELEAVRDSMLDAAGRLTLRRPVGIQVAGRGERASGASPAVCSASTRRIAPCICRCCGRCCPRCTRRSTSPIRRRSRGSAKRRRWRRRHCS